MKSTLRLKLLSTRAALLLTLATTVLSAAPAFGVTHGSLAASGELREIKGPLPPTLLFPWLPPVGSALLAVGVVVLLLLARRRSRRGVPSAKPLMLSAEAAFDLLERRWAEDTEEIGLLYMELSRLVRLCLEERTGLPALRMTTEDLLAGIAAEGETFPEHADRLRRFLSRCDLVKFAGAKPTVAEVGDDLAAARAIIVHHTEMREGKS